MTHFTDRKGREIEIEHDEFAMTVSAKHNGRAVGKVTVWEGLEDENGFGLTQLKFADVEEGYQRSGIGTELLRVASDIHGKLEPPPLDGTQTENPMTAVGQALVRKGQQLGYVTPFPDQPAPEDDEE